MHIRFELQFFKRSDIQHIPFVESIFPFIIIIDYGRLQQSTDEGKGVYILRLQQVKFILPRMPGHKLFGN